MSASMSVTRSPVLPVTRQNVEQRIDSAIATYQPVLDEARKIQEQYQCMKGSSSIAEAAELMGRVKVCLNSMSSNDLENEILKLQDFFSEHMTHIQESDGSYSASPYETRSGKLAHPSRWRIHPLVHFNADKEIFVPLFPKFQEIGTIHYELMVGDQETPGAYSLQASLTGISRALSFSYFQSAPLEDSVSSISEPRSSSPSLSVSSCETSSVSSESISAEHERRIVPSSITNVFFKNGWVQLEQIREDVRSGKSVEGLDLSREGVHPRIRREVYKGIAFRNGITDKDEAAHWGKPNWSKLEQKDKLLQVIDEVQAKCEAGSIRLDI